MEGLPAEYQQNPVILYESGVRCWILARTAKTSRGTTRQYRCSSEKWSTFFGRDHVGHESKIHWTIQQMEPVSERDEAGWASFSIFYVTAFNGETGPWNIWPMLGRAVRGTFGKGARVSIGAKAIREPDS
jgi:hypothetical protein